jgi:hypothetical protein
LIIDQIFAIISLCSLFSIDAGQRGFHIHYDWHFCKKEVATSHKVMWVFNHLLKKKNVESILQVQAFHLIELKVQAFAFQIDKNYMYLIPVTVNTIINLVTSLYSNFLLVSPCFVGVFRC